MLCANTPFLTQPDPRKGPAQRMREQLYFATILSMDPSIQKTPNTRFSLPNKRAINLGVWLKIQKAGVNYGFSFPPFPKVPVCYIFC